MLLDPGQAVHLTNEMSHGEDGVTRVTKHHCEPPPPPSAPDCTNSPKFREELAKPAN